MNDMIILTFEYKHWKKTVIFFLDLLQNVVCWWISNLLVSTLDSVFLQFLTAKYCNNLNYPVIKVAIFIFNSLTHVHVLIDIHQMELVNRLLHRTTICQGDNCTGKNFLPPIKTRSPMVKAVKLMACMQAKSPLKVTT